MNLLNYVDPQTLKDLHLDTVSDGTREQTLINLGEELFIRITAKLAESLSAEDVAKFTEITKDKGDKEAMEYITTRLPDAPDIIQTIAKQTIEEYKQLVAV